VYVDKALEINAKYVPAIVNKGFTLNELEEYEDAI